MQPLIKTFDFDLVGDERGFLVALEENKNIPFSIKRVYFMTGMNPNTPRGFHAHKQLEQIAICVSGKCRFVLDDGFRKESYELSKINKGLYIGDMVWREMHDFSEDCVLLVLASEHFDEADYIRDYDEFLTIRRGEHG